jgi:tetratricopeptide (TPR) repeat protein
LSDTIAWSYDLLSPDAQRLFRYLSIFKGGWLLDAAEAVAGGESGLTADHVLQETETLIEHSLIQSHEWLDGLPRFTMLETIREFGQQQLAASEELDLIHHRLAAFLLQLNTGATEQLRSPRFKRWLQRGDAEIENVRLSLDWATTHDPELALRLAREIGWYLLTRGGFIEARQRLERALARADNIPDDLRAGALLDRAMHATTYLDFETANEGVEAALTLYRQLGDDRGIAECVHAFGRIANWSNDYERARLLFEEALVRFRALDASTLTVCCANLSAALLYLGEREAAAEVLAEGLAHGERLGDVWALVLIVGGMADIERFRGALERARNLLRRGFELLRDLQDPRYIAQDTVSVACLAIDEGEDAFAARLLGAVSGLRRTIGLPPEPDEPEYVRLVPIERARIGDESWNDAWQIGQTLSQSEVIDLVLDWLAGDA